eukprot:TRINITY_DN73001_c0_g1_i1.p1 TRINITY_DN73001_c0_g1~~TRINITY_DN73001_c0_g1_i1.p1  ORF type:complete len:500 (+),score=192.90 TRINITY_DN73001_c0_g1_i1:47-1501(+)
MGPPPPSARASGTKRVREAAEVEEEERRKRPHPYGITPLGNMYMQGAVNCRHKGLGELNGLTDTCVGEVLGYLTAADLCSASATSRALYAFSHADDLWKPLVLFSLRPDGKFFFSTSWKQTYINTLWKTKGRKGDPPVHAPIQVRDFFSDTLYHPHRDASLPIENKWTKCDNIARVSAKTLSKEEFVEQYEKPGIPVVLTDLVTEWDAFKLWDWDYLLKSWGEQEFQCEAARLTIGEFKAYCDKQFDDRPIYLFDSKFADTIPSIEGQYTVPKYFDDDLFKVLGDKRPDFRWLIAGPTRSGSSFHKDPNATDAWNACLRGLKKWVFFPPSIVPPGVMCSEDGADVTSPMSLIEWFSNYYDRCDEVSVRPLEVLVRPGEMMYIPHGWWHLCLNLTPTLCITQNYASRAGLPRILSFLRDQPHCVSGVCEDRKNGFYSEFRDALHKHSPALLEEAEATEAAEKRATNTWATAMEGASEEGFSFNFD